jgi:hypothetical protein
MKYMTYKNTIRNVLKELPIQVEILKRKYLEIADKNERENKIHDLESYERRMIKGLNYLNNLEDRKIIRAIENIRNCSDELTSENKKRYLRALKKYRVEHDIKIDDSQIQQLINKLKIIPLIHTTKNPKQIKKEGIRPASDLWLTPNKSCANAMDIILGLDKCVFLTHGFSLKNFSESFVSINNELISNKNTIVSALDLFTFVLIKTKKVAPCAIQTEEWVGSLEDYAKNLFEGSDFWSIKAEYILTFFDSVDEYNIFARDYFYENEIKNAPTNEYPFLGEIKIFQSIKPEQIIG